MSTSKRKWKDTYTPKTVPGTSWPLALDLLSGPNPAKKQCKSKVVEKRAARFKKACPKVILERMDRVMSQR
jgi:hypothetical protein